MDDNKITEFSVQQTSKKAFLTLLRADQDTNLDAWKIRGAMRPDRIDELPRRRASRMPLNSQKRRRSQNL